MNKNVKRYVNNIGYVLLIVLAIGACYLQIKSYKVQEVVECQKTFDSFVCTARKYPRSHWYNKTASSCVNCKHTGLVKVRHWNTENLICGNCKSLHKGRIKKHYLYDGDTLKFDCTNCKHTGVIYEGHKSSRLNCSKCKDHNEFFEEEHSQEKSISSCGHCKHGEYLDTDHQNRKLICYNCKKDHFNNEVYCNRYNNHVLIRRKD